MKRVIIVGAGISGLAIAYRLQQFAPDVEITALEQCDRPGGKVWTERHQGFQVEVGPNGFLDTKPTTLALCREVNLADQLITASEESSRNRYLFLNGRLRALPGSLPAFLKTDLLSWRGKLGLLAEPFRPRQTADLDETVDAFARRRAGREVAEVFADALATGIHAGDPALLSVRAAFPRVAALEAEYGSVLKGFINSARTRRAQAAARGETPQQPGKMWSFRNGLRLLIEAVRERLTRPPVFGVGVRRIEPKAEDREERWIVSADGRERWPADVVILACPADQQAAIVADVDAELAERIGSIAYSRVAVVALGYRATDVPSPLNGFGYIVPQRTRRDILGVQWCSSIYPDRAPAGTVLLRALCGGWHRPEVVGWEDERLLNAVRAELGLATNIQAAPVFHHIVRWNRAIPQYHVGHLERVAWIEQRASQHPGLFLAGNAYHGVALNDCTEQAEIVAARVAKYLHVK